MTTITRMLRFAAQFKIYLACGHTFQCAAETVDKDQLYIGKRVTCDACQQAR